MVAEIMLLRSINSAYSAPFKWIARYRACLQEARNAVVFLEVL